MKVSPSPNSANPAKGPVRRPCGGRSGQIPQRGRQWRDRAVYASHAGRGALRRSRRKAGTAHHTAGSPPRSGEPEPRRPAPRRGRAWQAAGYFRSGATQPRALKPFVTGRVLDDCVERDVLAHDDPPHVGSAPRWSSGNQTLAARPASPPCLAALISFLTWITTSPAAAASAGSGSGSSCAGFRGRPGSGTASSWPIPASTAQAR